MTSLIQLSVQERNKKNLEVSIILLKKDSVKLHELILEDRIYLIHVLHNNLNTLIDLSNSKNYQLLYFDENKNFIGASYAINQVSGNFLIQSSSKWVMTIPFNQSFQNELLNKIEKFQIFMIEERKAEILEKLNKEYPLARHSGVGRLISLVRRMNAESVLNIPLEWRTGYGISVDSKKRGNEMTKEEWNNFFMQLCKNLERDYPSAYSDLF